MLPLQQPDGHEALSHTHCPVPVSHFWPVLHALHVAPPDPHDMSVSLVSASQVELLQHPAHAMPLQVQTPLEQLSPLPHPLQAAPFVPHSVCDWEVYGTHVVPLQQPFGHEVASQTHLPVVLSHSWPSEHPAQVAPPVPHEVYDSDA